MDSSQDIRTVLALINSLKYFKGLSSLFWVVVFSFYGPLIFLQHKTFWLEVSTSAWHFINTFHLKFLVLFQRPMSDTWSSPCTAFIASATTLCVCVFACVYDCWYRRAAGVTARPLPKVTSKESQANYYADQNWWRLRGLLQCNHISWPEKNLQADPNHSGYSARVSQDGGLPPMFSFHKTLFPYLRQAHDYQTKQASSSTFLQTCTCIYIFKKACGLQQIQCTQVRHLGYKKHCLLGLKKMQNCIIQSSKWCQGESQNIVW